MDIMYSICSGWSKLTKIAGNPGRHSSNDAVKLARWLASFRKAGLTDSMRAAWRLIASMARSALEMVLTWSSQPFVSALGGK